MGGLREIPPVLQRFIDAAGEYALVGAAHPEDRPGICTEYDEALADLLQDVMLVDVLVGLMAGTYRLTENGAEREFDLTDPEDRAKARLLARTLIPDTYLAAFAQETGKSA